MCTAEAGRGRLLNKTLFLGAEQSSQWLRANETMRQSHWRAACMYVATLLIGLAGRDGRRGHGRSVLRDRLFFIWHLRHHRLGESAVGGRGRGDRWRHQPRLRRCLLTKRRGTIQSDLLFTPTLYFQTLFTPNSSAQCERQRRHSFKPLLSNPKR